MEMQIAAKLSASDEFLACMFLRASDDARYKGLKQALNDDFLMGKGAYPKSITETLKLLK